MSSSFDSFDWEGNEQWQQYKANLLIPDSVDRHAILAKKKLKWYQANVDPSYEPPSSSSSSSSSTSSSSSSSSSSWASRPSSTSNSSSSPPPSSSPPHSSSERSAPSRATATGWLRSLSIALSYAQLMGHMALLVLSVLVSLPFLSPWHPMVAFVIIMITSISLQSVSLFRSHGRPRWSGDYGRGLVLDEESHFLFYAVIMLSSAPSMFAVAPIAARSLLFICRALQQIGPMLAPGLYSSIRVRVDSFASRGSDVLIFAATMELYCGLMMVIQLFTPMRNILLMVLYYQYLKMRYIISSNSKIAFGNLRVSLDNALLGPNTYCPRALGAVYQKLVAFLERQGQMPAQQ